MMGRRVVPTVIALVLALLPAAGSASAARQVVRLMGWSGEATSRTAVLQELVISAGKTKPAALCVEPGTCLAELQTTIDNAAREAAIGDPFSVAAFDTEKHAAVVEYATFADARLAEGYLVAPFEMRTSQHHVPAESQLLDADVALVMSVGEGGMSKWLTGTIVGSDAQWHYIVVRNRKTDELVFVPIRGDGGPEVFLYRPAATP